MNLVVTRIFIKLTFRPMGFKNGIRRLFSSSFDLDNKNEFCGGGRNLTGTSTRSQYSKHPMEQIESTHPILMNIPSMFLTRKLSTQIMPSTKYCLVRRY